MELSYSEKENRIRQFWQEILGNCITNHIETDKFKKCLLELSNPNVAGDILQIWIKIFRDTLDSPQIPFFLQNSIIQTILHNKTFFDSQTIQYQLRNQFFDLYKRLLTTNQNSFPIFLQSMINNFYQEINETTAFVDVDDFKISIGNFFLSKPGEILDYFNKVSQTFQQQLHSINQQYILLEPSQYQEIYQIFQNYKNLQQKEFLVFYGWREKEKLSSSFFISQKESPQKKILISYVKVLDYIINKELDQSSEIQHYLKTNSKLLDFYFSLFRFYRQLNKEKFEQNLIEFFSKISLNYNKPGFKFVLINLILFSQKYQFAQECINIKILTFLHDLDLVQQNSSTTNLRKQYQIYLKIYLTYIHHNFYNHQKTYLNKILQYTNKKLLKISKNKSPNIRERIDVLFNYFCQQVLSVKNIKTSQYIYIYTSWGDKLDNQQTFEELFIQKLFQKLFNKQTHYKDKEQLIVYIYSYVNITNTNLDFLQKVVLYIFKYFSRISKQKFQQIKTEYRTIQQHKNILDLQGKQLKAFMSYFNKQIFINLVYFLGKLLNEKFCDFQTENIIDLINEFENYFRKYSGYIKVLIKNNSKAHQFFKDLNNIIKNPIITQFFENDLPLTNFELNSAHSDLLNSHQSFSTLSHHSFSSYTSFNKSACHSSMWNFNEKELPFDIAQFYQFREFFDMNHSKCKVSCLDTDNSRVLSSVYNNSFFMQ